ncbi:MULTISPECIES: ATP-binding protein [unclassified Rubrivivax]|uniref:sensor histidine kinase n=1 Tax=unclassified Rubrivivax TaxID=2649762 RepID=UPI0013E8FC2E|nr:MULTISPECIES: ATP-binding protein [unclassified Rubrivivax]MCC9598517.1 two-component sensor histidine kinase [Rubrivivax sp. JA1055]MCC9648218.1 two-component sensor histidine kinase [Rubrivivax sp. JA1029]
MLTLSSTLQRFAASAAPGAERRLSKLAIGAAGVLIVLAWATVALVLWLRWHDAIAGELRQNTNLARAFEEQTVRVLAAVDQATVRARDDFARHGGDGLELPRYANETGLVPGILVQLSLVGADGRFIGSNLDPDGRKTGHVDLSEREHVRVHLAPTTLPPGTGLKSADDLWIGKPVLGKVSKRWTIQISRRISAADGRVIGVVVASLDPGYFEDVYRRAAIGSLGAVTLVGQDLSIRARVVGGESANQIGEKLKRGGAFSQQDLQREGTFSGVSTLDGLERYTAYRRIADYPLYVLVATASQEALVGWRTTRNIAVVLTLLLTGAVAAGALVFVAGLRRLEAHNAALRASEAQANAANNAKSEFLAAISHELRTPLTSIRGFAELMEHRLDNPKFRDQAGLIRKGAEYLNQLLGEILDLAKVEAGSMTLSSEPVNLGSLVQGTVDFYALTAAGKGLTLAVEIDPEAPQVIVADGLRVKQILNNLLSNAIKFTPAGRVDVMVERLGDRVLMHVEDTGPGIAPELHETIFERFRQGSARVSYEHGGTGLGLALSRALAQLMGGTLTLASEPGRGARFTLALTIVLPATATPPQPMAVSG